MNPQDTIAALATPVGNGGIAVIRVSGRESIHVADLCVRLAGARYSSLLKVPERTALLAQVIRNKVSIDEVLVTVFRGPRSFTAEDTVEIACHGGGLVTRLVLETVLTNGARPAVPGEFTLRAYLNGRMDLTQAEAVADLIHARTERALLTARLQMSGSLSVRINALRDGLISVLAHIEAHIDFPDEDIQPDTVVALLDRLKKASQEVEELLRTADEGRILKEGVRVAIIGPPNAGKSSLLNQLLGQDRAIVSPIAGTTRDTIEESATIRGTSVVFVDTAGLRSSSDILELEGIRRSREAADAAHLILHVLDGSIETGTYDAALLEEFAGRTRILVINKADLPVVIRLEGGVEVSCRTGLGLEALKETIDRVIWAAIPTSADAGVAINSRHRQVLARASAALVQTSTGLSAGLTLELVAFELRVALRAVGEVVGGTSTDDLLDSIFSQFCLGK